MTPMETKLIKTEAGTLELVPATADQLRGIARYWPMELLAYKDGSPDFGLVFQHGDEEVYGVKMQFVDMPEDDAQVWHYCFRNWIASALPGYLEKHHQGVMVPCAYMKQKSPGMAEAGMAFFVAPGPQETRPKRRPEEARIDEQLGAGAACMVLDMVNSLGEPGSDPGHVGSRCAGRQLTVIGMDVRPRLKIGGLAMHFVIEGQNILVVKYPLSEKEPVWTHLVRAGFRRLPYASMVPAGLSGPTRADLKHV